MAKSEAAAVLRTSSVYSEIDVEVANSIAAHDVEAIEQSYWKQDQFVFIPQFLSPSLCARLTSEVARFDKKDIKRVYAPLARRGGAVSQIKVAAKSPALDAFYRSPSLLALIRALTRMDLEVKAREDAHGATLLFYQKKGDYCAHHYDGCGCKGSENFTLTLGLVHPPAELSKYELFRKDKQRPVQKISLALTPGSAVFYRGDRIYHGVSPVSEGEERIVFSLTYSEVSARPSGLRLVRHMVNDLVMFGLGGKK